MSEQTPEQSKVGEKSVADLTDAEIANLTDSDVGRFQLQSIKDNTQETQKSNRSQLQQNINDVRDRKLNANIGLQKAWGEAVITGLGTFVGMANSGGQRAMKPLVDGLRTVFSMCMSVRESNLNKYLSEKQEVGVEMKLISAGVHPENGNPLSPEQQQKMLKAMHPRLVKYGLASSTDEMKMSKEEVAEAAAEGRENAANGARQATSAPRPAA